MSRALKDYAINVFDQMVSDAIVHHPPSHFTQSHPDYEYCSTRCHKDQVRLPPDGGWEANLSMGWAGVVSEGDFNVNYYMRKKAVLIQEFVPPLYVGRSRPDPDDDGL